MRYSSSFISPPSGRLFCSSLFDCNFFFFSLRIDAYRSYNRFPFNFFVSEVLILWISVNVSFGAKEKNFCSLEKDTITNGTIIFKRFHKRAQAKFVIAFFPKISLPD